MNMNNPNLNYKEVLIFIHNLLSGAKPQLARDWLPLCTKIQLVMTVNLRELRTILKLRLSTAAHPEMRKLANMILDIVKFQPHSFR